MTTIDSVDLNQLANNIKAWGKSLGFQQVGICDVDLKRHETFLQNWLDAGYHGTMSYMAQHGMKRARPDELLPGTLRAISVRLDYLPPNASFAKHLADPRIGYISRYALGRDYHKLVRKKLKQLGDKIKAELSTAEFRPFVDSAPVLEHALAEKAGIGWTGKHSLTLNKEAGSWFFLGELLINLPLPTDTPVEPSCGTCNACITLCPTNAIVKPYVVDARRCVSYLTIEHEGKIDEALRPLMGNRIYGCDDCQLACPYNKAAPITEETDFSPRSQLFGQPLITLFEWSEETFLAATEGSPIRRIGYARWQRNLAIAMGNMAYTPDMVDALNKGLGRVDANVDEHIHWALQQHQQRLQRESRKTVRLVRSVQKGMPRDA
ncbi:tRNA epoxyqueuosine(34) reductase QueG [Alteromonas oceanisediminis]|uniref:tRNA epoxyqueuosine(34) reductase QueG n=1 Tax=Alteromonas oceanisediminis TaxID=2836180 RepID=UPI001BD9C4E5|nr:tRNA epoxyqueuosine(34) reductase QueG [Alteromonas oceanisediminis]MBT0586929.1 tRNA epoxyqueuosine(34) reductase QueG [Alteromonas oceanisediminis]